jgi:dephospho-CoA kinase
MTKPVPLLILSGSMGAGKTTVLSEASDLLVESNIAHAALDLDWLGVMHPPQGRYGEGILFTNLAAVWPHYRGAGARRLLIARVVEDRAELRHYRQAVPGAEIVVCRLRALVETMANRLRTREPGMFQSQALARSRELEAILNSTGVEDFIVDNDGDRPVTEVAREVLTRAGWL